MNAEELWDSLGQESKSSPRPPVQIKKISYTHDAMIDLIVANPAISQRQLAAHFGYTETWISLVFNSDNFKERLAERKEEIIDPVLRMGVEEKLRGLLDKSISVLLQKLHESPNPNHALKALEIGTRALGYGAEKRSSVTQNNYIALVPPTSVNPAEWAAQYQPAALPAIDVTPKESNGD